MRLFLASLLTLSLAACATPSSSNSDRGPSSVVPMSGAKIGINGKKPEGPRDWGTVTGFTYLAKNGVDTIGRPVPLIVVNYQCNANRSCRSDHVNFESSSLKKIGLSPATLLRVLSDPKMTFECYESEKSTPGNLICSDMVRFGTDVAQGADITYINPGNRGYVNRLSYRSYTGNGKSSFADLVPALEAGLVCKHDTCLTPFLTFDLPSYKMAGVSPFELFDMLQNKNADLSCSEAGNQPFWICSADFNFRSKDQAQ